MPDQTLESAVATLRQLAADAAAGRMVADLDDPTLPDSIRRTRASLLEGTLRRVVADALPPQDSERGARIEAALARLPALEHQVAALGRGVAQLAQRIEALAQAQAQMPAPLPEPAAEPAYEAARGGGTLLGLACLVVGAAAGVAIALHWEALLALALP
jgi:hypothetical protein